MRCTEYIRGCLHNVLGMKKGCHLAEMLFLKHFSSFSFSRYQLCKALPESKSLLESNRNQ